MLTIDHWIFGNGFGLGSPFFDARYYWLVDEYHKPRDGKNGQLYTWTGLCCFQWTRPNINERRLLAGHTFQVCYSDRRWGRVQVYWSLTDMPRDVDLCDALVETVKKDLDKIV